MKAEEVKPYDQDAAKTGQVREMFNSIAPAYDVMNRMMTMGIDTIWRRKAVDMLRNYNPRRILDVATGTGDLAFLIDQRLKPDTLLGIDLSEGMLSVAREKAAERGVADRVSFAIEDCLSLSLPDNSYDAITVAYGVRNFENLKQGFAEMYRVLSPGGVLCVIELSTPEHFPFRQLYKFYTYTIIPLVGRIISRDKQAYSYLPRSVAAVAQGEEMLDIFRSVGFKNCRLRRLTFGACTIYMGEK
ncbi:MAG: bifunctional demethylmenaquinone methyltransferase/2-methoxy-6-polyprenyl-1,4-benzoquinol methylase UbiE [Bacteroidaceae bacterium]|nr:bifunctional demethylmenaquinone methyltransferase/2-methoxy-6-polyprenyl-1,4-benzoquinol methylase UbiE [Bacteroidaceae bacterium]